MADTIKKKRGRPRKRPNSDEQQSDDDDVDAKRSKHSPSPEPTTSKISDVVIEIWRREASAFHVIELDNARKLQIEFFYDKERIALEDNKFADDLNDVCFIFSRATSHKDYDDKLPTTFNVDFEDKTLTFFDRNRDSARLRLGPFLAHHLGDLPIISQSNRKLDLVPQHTVKVYVENSESIMFFALKDDVSQFSSNCTNRGIRVSDKVYPIPTEVTALFSDYFYNIFYGGYKESKEQWVEMPDVDADTIREIIHDTVIRHDRWFGVTSSTKMTWKLLVSILEHCDRFSMSQQSLNFQSYIKQYIERLAIYTRGTVIGVKEVSRIIRSDDLMKACVNIRHLPECLDVWEKQYAEEISPDFAAIITERRLQLHALCRSRLRLRMSYLHGDIVCSMFDDIQPVLIKSLIDFPLNAKRYCDLGSPQLPRVHLARQVEKDDTQDVRIYKPQGRFFLTYIDFSPRPQLRICDRLYKNGWVVGVVIEGEQHLNVDIGGMIEFVFEKQSAS